MGDNKDSLPKLYSISDVLALWPKEARPSERLLRSRARGSGFCRVVGRHLAFTTEDINNLIETLKPWRNSTHSQGSIPGATYRKARDRLLKAESKRIHKTKSKGYAPR